MYSYHIRDAWIGNSINAMFESLRVNTEWLEVYKGSTITGTWNWCNQCNAVFHQCVQYCGHDDRSVLQSYRIRIYSQIFILLLGTKAFTAGINIIKVTYLPACRPWSMLELLPLFVSDPKVIFSSHSSSSW